MFNFSSRLAGTYALTGGFFIFSQALVLMWLNPDRSIAELSTLTVFMSERLANIPSAIQPALTSLLVALALLSVFFFGVLLDLIGSIYVAWEINLFRAQIERNKTWLIDYIKTEFNDYAQEDFNNILSGMPPGSLASQFFGAFRLWRLSPREQGYKALKVFSLVPAFQRSEQLLILQAFKCQSDASLNLLNEKVGLCRTSRAVTTCLLIITAELYLYTWYANKLPTSTQVIATLLTGLAVFMTVRAYSRLCITLFAMVYIQMRSERNDQRTLEKSVVEGIPTDG